MIIFFDAFPIILVAIFAVIGILFGIVYGVESTIMFLQNNLSIVIILLMLIRQRKLLAVVYSPIDVFCTLPPLLLLLIEITYPSGSGGSVLWDLVEFILGLVAYVFLYAVFIVIVSALKIVICMVSEFISETIFKAKPVMTDIIELVCTFLLAFLVLKVYIGYIQWAYDIQEVKEYPSYISNVLSWMLAK